MSAPTHSARLAPARLCCSEVTCHVFPLSPDHAVAHWCSGLWSSAPRARHSPRIDAGRRSVQVRGRSVQLTYVEFELLRTLASHPGRVYSRRMLLESLWGAADYREPRTIDVHVRHLREKLEADPADPEYILTVRGVGYRFRDP